MFLLLKDCMSFFRNHPASEPVLIQNHIAAASSHPKFTPTGFQDFLADSARTEHSLYDIIHESLNLPAHGMPVAFLKPN